MSLLHDDEDVDIGIHSGTVAAHGTEDACPKDVSLVLLLLPEGSHELLHLIKGGNKHIEKSALERRWSTKSKLLPICAWIVPPSDKPPWLVKSPAPSEQVLKLFYPGWQVKVILPSSQKSWIGHSLSYLFNAIQVIRYVNRNVLPYQGHHPRKLLLCQGGWDWRRISYVKTIERG
jgi:hypothetical protein